MFPIPLSGTKSSLQIVFLFDNYDNENNGNNLTDLNFLGHFIYHKIIFSDKRLFFKIFFF